MLNIKSIREARGMSQKYVAVSLGVRPPQVSKWEAGATEPTIENLVKLSRLFGVTVDQILGLADQTGQISAQESLLLQAFRSASPDLRQAACAVLGVPAIEKDALIG